MSQNTVAAIVALGVLLSSPTPAATVWHVDAAKGDDAHPGTSAAAPFRTLQKACTVVNPGDTVVVHPGVYFERPRLTRAGTPDRPIVFKADAVEKNRVVITQADPQVRQGKVPWTLEDAGLGLYSIPFPHLPARALADGVDLLPYPTLEGLKTFMLSATMPGARHGVAFDASSRKLYIRLHARYGHVDPNRRLLALSPPPGRGDKGQHLDQAACFTWGILTEGPAHVVLDGFTFETPGVAGVYVRGSHATVRNSWFLGCRFGVAGGPTSDNDTWSTDHVGVEQCDYTQFPAYADAEEVLAAEAAAPGKRSTFFWWHRKGIREAIPDPFEYETGLVLNLGRACVLRRNLMRECFDALSHHSVGSSTGMEILENRFERIVDNALETENHAVDVRFHHNEIVDAFMPISWQPLGGTPWPGPVAVYRNMIHVTPGFAETWEKARYATAAFKIGANDANWKSWKWMKDVPRDSVSVPGDGFAAYNNTVVMPSSHFLERVNGSPRKLLNFTFANNILIVRPAMNKGAPLPEDTGLEFGGNLAIGDPEPSARVVAGAGGKVVDAAAVFRDPARPFELSSKSPAAGTGAALPGRRDSSGDAGAVRPGEIWKLPPVGPQPR